MSVMKRICVLLALAACDKAPAPPPAATTTTTTAPAHPSHVTSVRFKPDALGVEKRFLLYLPDGYATSTKHYPVFYYLHGLTGDETNWTKNGHLDEVADAMKLDAIIVMPDGDDSFYIDSKRFPDYDACMASGDGLFNSMESRSATCVRTANYETYIVKDLIGYVDSHYRTIATRDGRAIAGLSMGGYGALMLAGRHPDLFAATASHSGVDSLFYDGPLPYDAAHVKLFTGNMSSWGADAEPIGAWMRGILGTDDRANWEAHDPVTLLTKLGPGKLAIYLDCGTEDGFHLDAAASYLHDQLTANHIESEFFLGPGRHDFDFWRPREPESLKFLRDHTTAAK
jgi:S-formylglutathione hydrolase FrmB